MTIEQTIQREVEFANEVRYWASVFSEEVGLRVWDDNEERPKTIQDAFENLNRVMEEWNEYRANNR